MMNKCMAKPLLLLVCRDSLNNLSCCKEIVKRGDRDASVDISSLVVLLFSPIVLGEEL